MTLVFPVFFIVFLRVPSLLFHQSVNMFGCILSSACSSDKGTLVHRAPSLRPLQKKSEAIRVSAGCFALSLVLVFASFRQRRFPDYSPASLRYLA
jgi:hypothetical protein